MTSVEPTADDYRISHEIFCGCPDADHAAPPRNGSQRDAVAMAIATARANGKKKVIEAIGKVLSDSGCCDCDDPYCPSAEATCEELGHEPCLGHKIERALKAAEAASG